MNIEKLTKLVRSNMFKISDDNKQAFLLCEFMINELKGSIVPLILAADEIRKKEQEKKDELQYRAIDNSVSLIATMNREMKKLKGTPKKLKSQYDFYFSELYFMTPVAMSLFPEANSDYGSQNQKEFFDRFKESVMENKEGIVNGGSKSWAIRNGYYDYYMKIIKKDEE